MTRHTESANTVEKTFTVAVLLLSMGAFLNLAWGGSVQDPSSGMLGMQVLWSLIYTIVLLLCFRNSISPFQAPRSVLPLLALVVFVFASSGWSADPALSARRAAALVLTLVFGTYFALRFEVKQQFRLLSVAFTIAIVLSFLFEFLKLNPDEGIPGWYGIFYQKNTLARNMTLSALVFLFWKRLEPEYKTRATIGFLASVVLVLLARSATSVLVLMVLLFLLHYLRWSLRKSWLWASSGIAVLLGMAFPCVLWVAAHLEAVAGGLGRDPLLTGRVPLWIMSTAAALQRPWFGFGYEAFWLPDQVYARRIWNVITWHPAHAHNGFLELWLEVGLCGAALFLIGFGFYAVKALRFSYKYSCEPIALWPLIFLIFMVVGNLAESSLLSANSLYFILYVSVASLLSTRPSEMQAGVQRE